MASVSCAKERKSKKRKRKKRKKKEKAMPRKLSRTYYAAAERRAGKRVQACVAVWENSKIPA